MFSSLGAVIKYMETDNVDKKNKLILIEFKKKNTWMNVLQLIKVVKVKMKVRKTLCVQLVQQFKHNISHLFILL